MQCWGVYDSDRGIHPTDADAFFVTVDASEQSQWVYGCCASDLSMGGFSWQRVPHGTTPDKATSFDLDVGFVVDSGNHELVIWSRETRTSSGNFSAIAKIYLSLDKNATPAGL
jgi:hypothetical protein